MVRRLAAALEPYDPMFIEEPVLPEHNDALPAIRQSTTTPIATGERMYSRWDFKEVFETDAVDLIQPDVSHAGGITELKKIASWQRRTTYRSRRTARSGRSRSRLVSRLMPARRTC